MKCKSLYRWLAFDEILMEKVSKMQTIIHK